VLLRPPPPKDRPDPCGKTIITAPLEPLPDAALSKISVIAEAMKLLRCAGLIDVNFCFYTNSRCLRKKAYTVAKMPQGPPFSWKIA